MKLRTRLLLFFQGALAVVLVGFSVSLYVLASPSTCTTRPTSGSIPH